MTDRRTTITLGWRAPSTSARRRTDPEYVEVDQPAEVLPLKQLDQVQPRQQDCERRDIGSRLENWARWNNAGVGRREAASQTGAICDRMRKAVEGSPASSAERRGIDEDDAWRM